MSQPTHPRVNILLSTYNGERFVGEQLDSLFSQTYPNIAIHIRDDGSTDDTVDIIDAHPNRHRLASFDIGGNIGVVPSFLTLSAQHGAPGELYAFCDQDDVWKPEKIARAMEKILACPAPDKVLYCSRLEYVDERLGHLGYSRVPQQIGFSNAIVENIAVGCTTVFGDTIRRLLLEGAPENMMMHDWWTYLVASGFGEVIYDDFVSIQYRQHGSTVTAWEPGLKKIRTRAAGFLRRLTTHRHHGLDCLCQVTRFLNTYPTIDPRHKALAMRLIDLRGKGRLRQRLRYVLHPEVYRSDPLENQTLKILILLGLH